MQRESFDALMPLICSDLTERIMAEDGVSSDEAISRLYDSKLYSALEDEETKLWHYSTDMLYSLLRQEEETGRIDYPDV